MISNSTGDYIPQVVSITVEDKAHIGGQSGGKAILAGQSVEGASQFRDKIKVKVKTSIGGTGLTKSSEFLYSPHSLRKYKKGSYEHTFDAC